MAVELRFPPPPSRAVSIAVSAGLVLLWGFVRLVLFDTTMFPLTYAIPLLVCIWTRDRIALWSMAAIFMVFHVTQLFWMTTEHTLTSQDLWASLGATMANILIAAVAVHAIIRLRMRLEGALTDVRAQAEVLRAQGEELIQQNEELAEQAEELSRQTEELASQNEELQSQSEEIGTLNAALERKERLMETLLDVAKLSGSEHAVLQHTAKAALDLFGEIGTAATVFEKTPSGLRCRIVSASTQISGVDDSATCEDALAELVLGENRTAALNDVSLRPDLRLHAWPELPATQSVLCAPIRVDERATGVICIHGCRKHDWTDEQFRLIEWLADQSGRVLKTLRVQSDLRTADQRKSEFLATLSHELRNPLAPMRFALKLIEQGQTHDGNAVRIMQRQFQQLVRLVDDLLDATRLTTSKIQVRKTRADLISIVRHAVESSRPDIDAAAHALDVDLPTQPIWLEADSDRIAQIVTNLLNNATRYTPSGGQVTVKVSVSGDEAVLSVADTGIGLHADDADRVFDMFTQVGGPGSGGLGIGLAIVRGIAELHGGRVSVQSAGVGKGSEFRITLPLAPVGVEERNINAEELPKGKARRVLVVDDNVDAAAMMATLLELHGHTVSIAHDAKDALRVAHRFTPDVALLDIGLPGFDGYELARRLRQNDTTRHMRLVAVTGWGQEGDRARASEAGFDAHLTKPAEPHLLLSLL